MTGICSRYIADEDDLKDVIQDSLIHIVFIPLVKMPI